MQTNTRFNNATTRSIDSHLEADRDARAAAFEAKHGPEVDAEYQRLMSEDDGRDLALRARDLLREIDAEAKDRGVELYLSEIVFGRTHSEFRKARMSAAHHTVWCRHNVEQEAA